MTTPIVMPTSKSNETDRLAALMQKIVDAVKDETEGPHESEIVLEALAMVVSYFLLADLKHIKGDLSADAIGNSFIKFSERLHYFTRRGAAEASHYV